MEPIEEEKDRIDDLDKSNSIKEKSNKSLHDVSKGMLQPNTVSQVNKTMNYEIYHGNAKDKINCPQNTHLVNKIEFVNSVQYLPHKDLNLSQTRLGMKKMPKVAEELASQKDMQFSNTNTNGCYTSTCAKLADPRDLANQDERNELIDIIDQIHDTTQFPGPNFLHQIYPDYNFYLEEYYKREE